LTADAEKQKRIFSVRFVPNFEEYFYYKYVLDEKYRESRKTGFRNKQQARVYRDFSWQQTLGLRLF